MHLEDLKGALRKQNKTKALNDHKFEDSTGKNLSISGRLVSGAEVCLLQRMKWAISVTVAVVMKKSHGAEMEDNHE